jgi:AcrR family transcriptional regulator
VNRRKASVKQPRSRRYDQRLRADQSSRTRAEIIGAAHTLLDDQAAPRLTLEEVARAAGVSRATVYNQFGSRRALLAAVFEDLGRVIGYERVQAAQRLEDPRAALDATIREACRCWSSRRVAIRRILALGVLDREIDELNARYEQYRRAEIGQLAQRLEGAGLLRGISLVDASAVLGALTGPHAFELVDGATSPDRAADRLVHMASASLGLHHLTPT